MRWLIGSRRGGAASAASRHWAGPRAVRLAPSPVPRGRVAVLATRPQARPHCPARATHLVGGLAAHERVAHRQAQHRVAQPLQALVGERHAQALGQGGGVGEGGAVQPHVPHPRQRQPLHLPRLQVGQRRGGLACAGRVGARSAGGGARGV